MAKRTVYECDICKKETKYDEIGKYRRERTVISFCGIMERHEEFYICDSCLERIRKEIKGEE